MKTFIMLFLTLFCLTTGAAVAEPVHFKASAGQPLGGLLDRPAAGLDKHIGVLLLPMYRFTAESWQPLVKKLIAAGYTCLSLDLRGHGRSRYGADGSDLQQRVFGRDPALFNSMYRDVQAGAEWLYRTVPGLKKTVVIGASVGCSVAVQAVTKNAVKASAVVLMTPGENYLGVKTMQDIRNWPGIPVLILSSEEEQERGARPIFEQLKGQGAELFLYPQHNIHGTNMFGRVDGVEDFIVSWLNRKTALK